MRVAEPFLPWLWQVVDMAGLSRAERMAFYINIYNQLIVRTPAQQLHEGRVCMRSRLACQLDRSCLHWRSRLA